MQALIASPIEGSQGVYFGYARDTPCFVVSLNTALALGQTVDTMFIGHMGDDRRTALMRTIPATAKLFQ